MREYNSIVRVLAFHVKQKNYAYTDILSNALNVDAVEHALYDAMRDYLSLCTSQPQQKAQQKEPQQKEMEECCPSPEEVKYIERDIQRLFEEHRERPLIELLRLSRELAIKAVAGSIVMCRSKEGGSGGSQAQ
ncbi:MAG: hypothetical protein N3F67_06110 [Acidilobaceae archaeon]|nr:hypothetical protein [Acidilobaceae archaeon]